MFNDRFDAGYKLAQHLQQFKNDPNAVIIAIPRGALEIGSVLSRELAIPLDVVLTKKIGYPGNPEYAIGAASLDDVIVDKRVIELSGVMEAYLKSEIEQIRKLLQERFNAYHATRKPITLAKKTVIVVDDGVATGKTVELTIDLLKKQNPQKIIIAVPVASKEAVQLLKKKVDDFIVLQVPEYFMSVSQWYRNFDQVDDQEAIALLQGSFQ